MHKRNLKQLVLNLQPVDSAAQKTAIVTPNSLSGNTIMQESTSNNMVYQQGPACILPNLYLGACYTALNATHLTRHGITCIINVASEIKTNVPLPHIEYHHIKWTHCQRNLATSEFDRAIETIRKAHDQHQTVLIHCQQGIERSAALILAFLLKSTRCMRNHADNMAGQNWSLDRAFKFVKERAPKIRPNMELIYQLREYEQSIPMQQRSVDKRHTVQNRTKRSASVACSKPSTTNTLWTSSSSLSFRSFGKVRYPQQRPRSASLHDTSLSANLTFSATAAAAAPTIMEEQPLAVASCFYYCMCCHVSKRMLLYT